MAMSVFFYTASIGRYDRVCLKRIRIFKTPILRHIDSL